MKARERYRSGPVELHDRRITLLRYATGILLSLGLASAGFAGVEEEPRVYTKSTLASSLPSVATYNKLSPVPTTLEITPATVSATSTTVTPNIVHPAPSVVTTITTMPAPNERLESNRAESRTKAQSISREERCQNAVIQANVIPAPNYFITCGPEEAYNTVMDGDICPYIEPGQSKNEFIDCAEGTVNGQIRIHPDDWDPDTEWIYTVKHEVGHSYCITEQDDYTEPCADNWAQEH